MTEDQIVEAMAQSMFESMRGITYRDVAWDSRIADTQDNYRRMARAAIAAHKTALAEATRDILRDMEAAARVAQHEMLAAPSAPGWPATCAVLRHLKELRELLTAAPDQR